MLNTNLVHDIQTINIQRPIFIIGFMGAGKTFFGEKLAYSLNVQFLDSDEEIEKQENKKISDIFNDYGEHYFRNLEKKWIEQVQQVAVISCGGGLPCFNDLILVLRKKGEVIYLNTSSERILQQLKNNTQRPLLQNKNQEDVLHLKNKRELYYRMAHKIIKE